MKECLVLLLFILKNDEMKKQMNGFSLLVISLYNIEDGLNLWKKPWRKPSYLYVITQPPFSLKGFLSSGTPLIKGSSADWASIKEIISGAVVEICNEESN